jgi:DNA-binding response OmpR family regulator
MEKKHIFIVDDSLTVRMDLRAALSAAGFRVTACDSLAWAERALRLHAFACVVLDVVLPDGSGIDLLRRIRTDTELANLPIILLSSRAEVQSRIEGLSTGADEYIGKPYDRDYLVERVRQLVNVPESVAGTRGRKLLAVDDSATFLQALSVQLRGDGHEVVLAGSGREALEYLEVEPVDCVLLDLIMPELDGIEVCERIRRIPGREETPVLLMTALDDPALHAQARASHADAVVLKEPGLERIRSELHRLLGRRSGPG